MNVRHRARVLIPVAAVGLACLFTGCTSTNADDTTRTPEPSPSASTSASASPSASAPAFAFPDTTDPVQVAITLKYDDDDPSGEIIAGPAVLVADRPFTIEGQCEGDGIGFEVMTADGEKNVIADGDFDCDDPPSGQFTYQLPYAGPVQVNLTDTDDVDQAWVRVVQP